MAAQSDLAEQAYKAQATEVLRSGGWTQAQCRGRIEATVGPCQGRRRCCC